MISSVAFVMFGKLSITNGLVVEDRLKVTFRTELSVVDCIEASDVVVVELLDGKIKEPSPR